jgi:Tetratricopeptide repeat
LIRYHQLPGNCRAKFQQFGRYPELLEMAKINQSDRYRQRAALCYEIAATMPGDKAASMMRLGDTYTGLAEDFDKPRAGGSVATERNERPKCVKCGKEMGHTYALPPTDTPGPKQALRCDSCKEAVTTGITEPEDGEVHGREKVVEIRRAGLGESGRKIGAIAEQGEFSAILGTQQHAIKPRRDAKTKREGENKSRRDDATIAREPANLDRLLRERLLATCEEMLGPEHPNTATGIDALANLLYTQGDLAGARPLYERARAIREKVLGPEHPDVSRDSLCPSFPTGGILAISILMPVHACWSHPGNVGSGHRSRFCLVALVAVFSA